MQLIAVATYFGAIFALAAESKAMCGAIVALAIVAWADTAFRRMRGIYYFHPRSVQILPSPEVWAVDNSWKNITCWKVLYLRHVSDG